MHISPIHRATHFDILKQPASHCQLNPVQTFVRHSRRIKPTFARNKGAALDCRSNHANFGVRVCHSLKELLIDRSRLNRNEKEDNFKVISFFFRLTFEFSYSRIMHDVGGSSRDYFSTVIFMDS